MATKVGDGAPRRAPDAVIVEEPLEIRLDGELVTVTMRTPGHDFELAVGFCHAEGLLDGATVQQIRYCATGSAMETNYNTVTVDTDAPARDLTPRLVAATAACGVCGAQSVDDLTARLTRLEPLPPLDVEIAAKAAASARSEQALFTDTGAVHAAAAFDLSSGHATVVREDIGRHNAVDKVVGRLRLDGALPASSLGLFVSGRASFEMAQKAWAAGFRWLVAVGGVSSLAIDTAERANLGLAGFLRDTTMTVYRS